eukprot:TRINITY_DN3109_c0_g1_i1.p1 TRINITY_DN3109_c0_g1~~TRINITY_DN3109_c0_g1_i1.p1  ORF type:complete len:282 (+),score=55.79 TRINITY_DN3109_c0_g1_i1:68-913(+)
MKRKGKKRKDKGKKEAVVSTQSTGGLNDMNLDQLGRGYIISTDQCKESACCSEMVSLLSEFAEKYYPEESIRVTGSFEDRLNAELRNLRKKNTGRFSKFDLNCKGSTFVRVEDKNINPTELLSKIFNDISTSDTSFQTRFTSVVKPIEATCSGKEPNVLKMAETIIPKHFHEPNPPCRFKVEIKKRMSDCLRGSDVTSSLVKIVGRPHVVDTREPEKIVNLELFKSAVGISVTRSEDFPKGFNIRSYYPNQFANHPKQHLLKKCLCLHYFYVFENTLRRVV